MKKEHQLKDIPIVELLKIQYLTYEQRGNKWAYECFPQFPEKLVYKKLEQLHNRGLIDFGVSLRTGWLTEKGKEILKLKK